MSHDTASQYGMTVLQADHSAISLEVGYLLYNIYIIIILVAVMFLYTILIFKKKKAKVISQMKILLENSVTNNLNKGHQFFLFPFLLLMDRFLCRI